MLGMRAVILAAAVAATSLPACSDDRPSQAATEGSAAEASPGVLEAEMRSLVDELVRNDERAARQRVAAFQLPDARSWMTETFGPAGAGLADEYKAVAGQLPQLVDVLHDLVRRGQTRIVVERFTDPADLAATGYQATALTLMRKPVPLYSVRLISEADAGPSGVYHLWSFVYVDGRFRWIGKLRALAAAPRPTEGVDPLELRVRDRAAKPIPR